MNLRPAENIFRRFLMTGLVLAVVISRGQKNGSYRFINKELNCLQFASDSSAFARFFDKVENITKGGDSRITIVHIGGSHVQAGVWSSGVAMRYQFRQN